MGNRETIQEAKQTLSQINHVLATEPLTATQRKEFELHAAALAGVILHPWLPEDLWADIVAPMLGIKTAED